MKKTINLIGFSNSSRQLAFQHYNPEEDYATMNNGYYFQDIQVDKITHWFDIHNIYELYRNNARYGAEHLDWLRQEHPFPIFMVDHYDEFPSSVRYPLADVIREFSAYITSTISYMIAWAILEKYEVIKIWGIEMAWDSEYFYQRANGEYWIGIAQGRGIQVLLPEHCTLLRGFLYGVEDAQIAHRTTYEANLKTLNKNLAAIQSQSAYAAGQVDVLKGLYNEHEDLRERLGPVLQKAAEQQETIASEQIRTEGKIEQMNELLVWTDKQNIPADRIIVEAEHVQ